MSTTLTRPAARQPPRSAALSEAVKRCETTICAGLRVAAPSVPAIAAAWLEEAGNVGGGLVWRGPGDALWLLGAATSPCRRALDLLRGMGWVAELLEFPRDLTLLETALAEELAAPPPLGPGSAGSIAAGLDERAARLPADTGHTLATLWRMGATPSGAAGPQLLGQRWMVDAAALPAPPDVDWAGHAEGLLAARLLARAQRAQWPAYRKLNLPLLIDLPWMPPTTLPPPPAGPGHALVLPLAALPDLPGWVAVAAAAGWRLAWRGLTLSLAHLVERLPGAWLFSSPGISEGWPVSDRLVLSGLADRTALAKALGTGLALCSPLGDP